MEFIKFIEVLICVTLFTSQLWIVNSISLVSGPEDGRVAIGADFIFNCKVNDKNQYYIYWLYNNLLISRDHNVRHRNLANPERYTIIPNSFDLKISNVQLTDAGKYECGYDSNPNDNLYNPFHPRAVAILTVLQPPSANSPLCWIGDAIQFTSEMQVYVGESVKFKCSSEGHGNTSLSLNITESDNDITEHVFQDFFDWKQVESDELKIKNVDTELICYLESEALIHPKVCEIKLNVLLPVVAIEPESASVLESTDISFQCSGKSFKTDDLHYEWQILPDVPGDVVNFTTSILKITNLGKTPSMFDSVFIITCFVREDEMVLNSSISLYISPKNKTLTNNINPNGFGTSITSTVIAIIAVATVFVAILLVGLFLWRRQKLRDQTNSEELSNTQIMIDKQPYSAVKTRNLYSEKTGQPGSKGLNMGSNEIQVYYSRVGLSVDRPNDQEFNSNCDNIHNNMAVCNKDSMDNEPLYENKGFTSTDITKLNTEGLNYADLDLELVSSRDIIDTGPRTTYSTVTTEIHR